VHHATICVYIISHMRRNLSGRAPALNWRDIAERTSDGELVFVVEDKVYSIGNDFVHPGGIEV